jgi:hypothetical protein
VGLPANRFRPAAAERETAELLVDFLAGMSSSGSTDKKRMCPALDAESWHETLIHGPEDATDEFTGADSRARVAGDGASMSFTAMPSNGPNASTTAARIVGISCT